MKTDPPTLERLLDSYFEESLDAASREELARLLESCEEARAAFWQRAELEQVLEAWAERAGGIECCEPAPRRRPLVAMVALGSALAGGLAAALLMGWWLVPGLPEREPSPSLSQTQEPPSPAAQVPAPVPVAVPASPSAATAVAYLSRVSGVEPAALLQRGGSLVAGVPVTIEGGLLEIDFFSGARVFVQGPAQFTPDSDMRLALAEGRVQVEVPESAKGFVLELPDATLTDFGTSFGVEVRDGVTSRLQVASGEVELAGTRDGAPARRLVRGQAVSLAGSNGPDAIDFQPMGVRETIERESLDATERARLEWDRHCEQLAADPDLVVHFRFLEDEQGSRELLNRAPRPGLPRGGSVIAAEWSAGRWPGKPALAFRQQADRVRVDVPGEYPQASFLAWVRVDHLPRRYNGLFLSEFGIAGETHWQLSTDGRFWFGVRPQEERPDWSFHRAFSEPVLRPADFGSWRLLATTYDALSREVIHYLDGTEVHRTVLERSVPLRFGRATLGNFFDPEPDLRADVEGLGPEWSYRNWTGAIDEFALFSRALSADEIARFHEAGQPL